jgi:hypothetical protein
VKRLHSWLHLCLIHFNFMINYSLVRMLGALLLFSSSIGLLAQTTWTDGGGDASWSNTTNWSNGVPGTTTDVIIGTSPGAELIGLDTGGGITIKSLTFNAGLSTFSFVTLGAETLTVNGSITNNTLTGVSFKFDSAVFVGAASTWTGPLQFANNVGVGVNSVTLSGSTSFNSGINLNFDITNASTYGRFLGSGTATVVGATININGAYTGVSGDTFDFTTGNFSGATLGLLPTLSGGLVWNTSNFLTQGILSVSAVPEPATYAVVLGFVALGFGAARRRRKA